MRRREWLTAVSTAAIAGIAGCTGSDDSEPSANGDDETESSTNGDESTENGTDDEQEPEETGPSLDDFEFPEYASRDGVSATELRSDHFDRLIDAGSATISESEEFTSGGHTSESITETQISGAGIVVNEERNRTTEERWTEHGNGRELIKRQQGFQTVYQIAEDATSEYEALMEGEVSWFTDQASFSEAVSVVEIDDTLTARYDVVDFSESTTGPESDDSEVTGSLFVTEGGIIKRLKRERTSRIDGTEHVEAIEVTYSDIGSTNVSEPEWTDTARQDGRRFDATVTDDGYFSFELVNGDSLPRGSRVRVRAMGEGGGTTLPESVDVGDRLLVAVARESIETGVNEPPAGENEATGDFVRIALRNEGLLLYEDEFDRIR